MPTLFDDQHLYSEENVQRDLELLDGEIGTIRIFILSD
jgi:hypothetical protein